MIRIRNRAMARMPGVEKWRSGFRNGVLFSVLAAGAAVLAGITGPGYVTVLAADNMEQNQVMAGDDSLRLTGGGTSGDADDINIPDSQTDNTGQVYDFKDNKTTGTVTVTKVWDDGLTNEEREIPDIKISTKKPSKSTLGYTVTFHGNGMKFADGSEENMVVYNSAGEIVQGEYKMAMGNHVGWCTGEDKGKRVVFLDDGTPQIEMTGDLDLWAKEMTFEIKGYKGSPTYKNGFNQSILSAVTEVIFTDEIKPASAEIIDVDADSDGGVVAWTENDGTVMKVSTQIKGIKVQAAINSKNMFYDKSKIKKIDLKMLDISNVTMMGSMFERCSGLTSLDLTGLDTSNVTNMDSMFCGCSGLTNLDLTPLDTSKVKYMGYMFFGCSGLTSLDLTPLNTSNVTSMSDMFSGCRGLTSLDLTPLDTSKVTNMEGMFSSCRGLAKLDLSPMNTSKVTNMHGMFSYCSGLTSLDLAPLDTSNVTSMKYMFYGCSGLTSFDLTEWNTSNVTSMEYMFYGCTSLITITTGPNFKFVGTYYNLSGTWQNAAGEIFNGNGGTANLPSNVADTYTKISS